MLTNEPSRVQLGSEGGQVLRLGDAGVGPVAGVLDGAHQEGRLAEVQEERVGHLRVRLAQGTVLGDDKRNMSSYIRLE